MYPLHTTNLSAFSQSLFSGLAFFLLLSLYSPVQVERSQEITLERIEIIRDPGSTIDRVEAMVGIVIAITKRGKYINSTKMNGCFGPFDTFRAHAQHAGKYQG